MSDPQDSEVFELPNFELEQGATLRPAKLVYKTYGTLNADRSNAIVYPTAYGARHSDNEWLIGPRRALNPEKYFIIVPNMFGNGLSSSPSNTPPPHDRGNFPHITVRDNVRAQHRLVTERFGIERLELVTGWSMGGLQTYQWAVSYPALVKRALPFCGSSTTSPHNIVFLEGLEATLTADAGWNGGFYEQQPRKGLRAFSRVYAGWGFSQAFYWEKLHRQLGFESLEDFLVGFWEKDFGSHDANDLLAMLWTWKHADIGTTPGSDGDVRRALGSIRARTVAVPAEKDLYFPPEDEKWASQFIPNGDVRVIPGVWGHLAGLGINPPDTDFLDGVLRELLASSL
ncbi:alpha/beta fold hydrolase [Pendulispora albinea]|uniref:Alpha/beta fold hydrolase n=1 Tax=Pendulispora albinea TaxID=2741071 RepID=A0ABZ2LY65_9BACT